MKKNRVISTAVLFLLLGTSAFVYAQKGPKEKAGGGQKAQRTQQVQRSQRTQQVQRSQRTQQVQRSQRTQQVQRSQRTRQVQRSQRTQQVQRSQRTRQVQQQRQSVASNRGNNGNHYGRIPDSRFRAHFGRSHAFRMIRPRMINGYQRFQYNGYWFGFNEPWPSGWYYTDNVYVDYMGGAYYMYNPRHPGIRITLNLF